MADKQDLPTMTFPSKRAFADWLAAEHGTSAGVWIKIAKKATGVDSVSYREALDVALCYGWIDSHKDTADDGYWLQRFTPRKARGRWSQVNRARADELTALGLMQPAGQREVDAAKADGRWDAAYAPQKTAGVPEDLQAALDANPVAQAFFLTLDSRNRYAILFRVGDAKKPATRAARIEKFVAMLNAHEKIYP